MTKDISSFQTISRHQSSLVQSKSTIKCLVDILEYLDMRIGDDTNTDLLLLITDHLNAIGDPYPHYINMARISDNVVDTLFESMVANNYYTGSRVDFVKWLTITIGYYDTSDIAPFDTLEVGITLGLALKYIGDHNELYNVHANGIGGVLANWAVANDLLSIFISDSIRRFDFRKFRQVDIEIAARLLQRINDNLAAFPPVDPVLNYDEYPDLAADIINYEQAAIDGVVGVLDANMLDYEPAVIEVFNKSMDYYTNHLDYALSSTFSAAYAATITDLRSDVNSFYYKVFDFYTRLMADHWGIVFRTSINKMATRTLDLINLTGLSKSLVSVSIVPYLDGTTPKNRVVCSFDNFNPEYTEILIDDMSEGDRTNIAISITVNDLNEFIVYWAIGDNYGSRVFDGSGRLFNTTPHFLFVSPRVHYPDLNTIRISKLEIFNTSLTQDQCLFLATDFKHRHP